MIFIVISLVSISFCIIQINKKRKLKNEIFLLQNKDRIKNDFIANIIHDFRSPLTIIYNKADLAVKMENYLTDREKNLSNYKVIYDASLKLKNATDRLLELSRLESAHIKLKISKIDIKKFITEITDFYRTGIDNSRIKIDLDITEKEIDNFYSDLEKLEEIFHNILSNAIKFVDHLNGIIEIKLSISNLNAEIAFKDNGIGIAADELKNIFYRYKQLEAGEIISGSSGIGLAFVYELTKLLKGNINVSSDGLYRGTTFILNLPLGKTHFEKEAFIEQSKEFNPSTNLMQLIKLNIKDKIKTKGFFTYIKRRNSGGQYISAQSVFLIIEEHPVIQEIIMEYLVNAGYHNFIVAPDGENGLDAAFQLYPDIIIYDYYASTMKGNEFYNLLKTNPRFRNIPFVFLSTLKDLDTPHELVDNQISYISKPIIEKEFLTTVELSLHKYFEHLKALKYSVFDELTELYHKTAFIKKLRELLSFRKLRHFSIVLIDIDNFHTINEAHGYHFGDHVLHEIGKIINYTIREYDVGSRFHGNQFMLLLPETTGDETLIVINKLKKNIEQHLFTAEQINFDLSITGALFSLPEHEKKMAEAMNLNSLNELFEEANLHETDGEIIKAKKEILLTEILNSLERTVNFSKILHCSNCNYTALSENDIELKCPRCNSEMVNKKGTVIPVTELF